MRRLFALPLLMISVVLSATAQRSPDVFVVRAGRLLDVKTGKLLSNQTIVIRGDRVISIGSTAPAGAKVIDLSMCTRT